METEYEEEEITNFDVHNSIVTEQTFQRNKNSPKNVLHASVVSALRKRALSNLK